MSDIHPIVKQIIDRDCHVSMSDRQVVRHVISRLLEGIHSFRRMPKADRRHLVRDCLAQHRANRQLYVDVMSGRPVQVASPVEVPTPIQWPDLSTGCLTGPMLRCFMRQQRVTIRQLAARTGITQKRIRQLREEGANDPRVLRDLLQAIAGVDPGPIPAS